MCSAHHLHVATVLLLVCFFFSEVRVCTWIRTSQPRPKWHTDTAIRGHRMTSSHEALCKVFRDASLWLQWAYLRHATVLELTTRSGRDTSRTRVDCCEIALSGRLDNKNTFFNAVFRTPRGETTKTKQARRREGKSSKRRGTRGERGGEKAQTSRAVNKRRTLEAKPLHRWLRNNVSQLGSPFRGRKEPHEQVPVRMPRPRRERECLIAAVVPLQTADDFWTRQRARDLAPSL